MNRQRIHGLASPEFFHSFVARYHDKQYQTWLGRHWTEIGVDYDQDEALRKRIAAAIVSHFSEMSFATALKTMDAKSSTNDPAAIPRFEKMVDRVEAQFHSASLAFLDKVRPAGIIKDEHSGIIHAELFLLRLLTSFQASRRLINWGFFSEPLAILRSGLEQLAWAYAVGVEFNRKQLDKPNPPACIGIFKRRFAGAGLLYGALSDFSHMDFDAQKHFVYKEVTHAGVVLQSTEFKFFGLLFQQLLMIAYHYVLRDLRIYYINECGLDLPLRNIAHLLRHLVSHALMRPELDQDEIASRLSGIYFEIFPPREG